MKQPSAEIKKASLLLKNGRRVDAMLIYGQLAKSAGDDIETNVQLGHFCSELGDLDQAIAHYGNAVKQEPDNALFLNFLGLAYQQNGQPDQALEMLNRAMAANAEIPSVLNGLGAVYMGRADYAQARKYLEQAQRLKPSDANVLINLARTLTHLNEHESAMKHAVKALKLDSADPQAHYIVGRILAETGRTDEAIRHFENTIRKHRKFGAAYEYLARIKKFTASDQAFIAKTEKVLTESMPPEHRSCVHYALGKMYDDCSEWNQAFEHYRQGNLLQKKTYDVRSERKLFDKLRKVFDASSLRTYGASGHPSAQPVFIVGMPRSGTTLMERIIASHPKADGAGELAEMPRIARQISPADNLRQWVSDTRGNLTASNIREYAEAYLGVLCQGRETADRIVDKLPDNYVNVGLISILFPNATIIHAIRDPLDTCLSCYFQNFTNVRWACDLELIGQKYRFYREVMAYWHSVLPEGKILDVHYERLIEDREIESRRMIEGCGLQWDSNCLNFHQQDGVVKSASLWQVRQPIYRSSVRRWKNYASHVGELANSLSDYLDDDGRRGLESCGVDLGSRSGIAWLRRMFN